jgi:CRP/FNR family cyclic AMP-dependent transcriptional regulator
MSRTDVASCIERLSLFDGLSPAEKNVLAERLHMVTARTGANLMALEQPGEVAYLLVEGTVRVQAEQEDGSLVILAFLGAGDLVGEMSVLDEAGRSATVIAVEPCRLLWMGRRDLRDALRTMPVLGFNALRLLARRLRVANARFQALATLDVPGRVAVQLLALAEEYGHPAAGGTEIPLRLTQSDLASMVGASRERVNQVLVGLRRRQALASSASGRFVILDAEALVRLGR